ncbi:MAG TPA: prepilin-type N-terminal cleavage/methylation domain-containing protein [Gallionella sp.]|nr:prepilin-type N-terminal cleavage/methylation domain-containing protein [Gallionella sp.]
MSMSYRQQNGFTLVEMIMVIAITGILGGMVAMFLNAPIRQYMDVSRRAELTDVADTALRRLARDIRTAVPNSIRVPVPGGVNTFIEFLPARDGGRYRANAAGGAGGCAAVPGDTGGDALDFTGNDTCFEIIGPPMTFGVGDQIVIGSTQSDGNPPYDATAAGILRPYNGAVGAPQAMAVIPALRFPAFAELQSQRFDVVTGPVTFACIGALGADANGNGTASLVRYAGYGFTVAQVAPPFAGGTLLASNVSGCAIEYSLPNQRNGLVSITLTLTRGGENVSLHHEIHVSNAP